MMNELEPLPLGVILCKHCHCTLDTVDTEKVAIFYLECDQAACILSRGDEEKWQNEVSRDS